MGCWVSKQGKKGDWSSFLKKWKIFLKKLQIRKKSEKIILKNYVIGRNFRDLTESCLTFTRT